MDRLAASTSRRPGECLAPDPPLQRRIRALGAASRFKFEAAKKEAAKIKAESTQFGRPQFRSQCLRGHGQAHCLGIMCE
jgi:hypothetical protein